MSTATIVSNDSTANSAEQVQTEPASNSAAAQVAVKLTPGEYLVSLYNQITKKLGSPKLPEQFRAVKKTALAEIQIDFVENRLTVHGAIDKAKRLRQEIQDEFDKINYEDYLRQQALEAEDDRLKSENELLAPQALEVVCFLSKGEQLQMAQTMSLMGIGFTVGMDGGDLTLVTEEDLANLRMPNRVTYRQVNTFLHQVVDRGTIVRDMHSTPEQRATRSNGGGNVVPNKKPWKPAKDQRHLSAQEVRTKSKRH